MTNRVARDERPTRFASLFRVRPFAVLFGAELQSLVGDQLARVSLAVLVFDRTGNTAATALTYALTFLPAILGGAVLGRLGDKLARRTVMVGCDVVRAACFAVMAVPGLSLWVLEVLLAVAVLLEPAFTAAQASYLATCLDEDQFRAATGLRMATNQIGQIGGFAVGGALVALFEPRGALALNAATFAVSAIVITVGLPAGRAGGRHAAATVRDAGDGVHDRVRDSADGSVDGSVDRSADGTEGTRGTHGAGGTPGAARGGGRSSVRWRLRDDPRLAMLIALAALAGFFVVPEGLVVPFAHDLGQTTRVAGILLAAIPAGGAVGALVLTRFVPRRARARASAAMAAACGLPLLVTGWSPPWPVILVAWFLSGAGAAYLVEVFSRLAALAPDAHRSHTMGVAAAVLTGAQGVGLALFGVLAQSIGAGWAVTVAGSCGIAAALLVMALGHVRHAGISQVWGPRSI